MSGPPKELFEIMKALQSGENIPAERRMEVYTQAMAANGAAIAKQIGMTPGEYIEALCIIVVAEAMGRSKSGASMVVAEKLARSIEEKINVALEGSAKKEREEAIAKERAEAEAELAAKKATEELFNRIREGKENLN